MDNSFKAAKSAHKFKLIGIDLWFPRCFLSDLISFAWDFFFFFFFIWNLETLTRFLKKTKGENTIRNCCKGSNSQKEWKKKYIKDVTAPLPPQLFWGGNSFFSTLQFDKKDKWSWSWHTNVFKPESFLVCRYLILFCCVGVDFQLIFQKKNTFKINITESIWQYDLIRHKVKSDLFYNLVNQDR